MRRATVGRLKVMLLVNPHASSVTARTRVVISRALSADHDVETVLTHRRGHAARLANGAVNDGFDVVAVLGGDGTFNEAANGLAGSDVTLAPLPGGSTNVFTRTIGLPDDPVEAAEQLLKSLAVGSVRRIGLGQVNGRYFLFHTGIGFDAAVVAEVEKRDRLKRYANHALFAYAAADTWLRGYDRSASRFMVRHADGEQVPGQFAICLNTDPYTYLGTRPLSVAPEATLDSPLVLVTLRSLTLGRLLRVLGGAVGVGGPLAVGPVSQARQVDYRTEVHWAAVEAGTPFPYQVDGEYLGEVTGLEFTHEPEALALALPTGSPAWEAAG